MSGAGAAAALEPLRPALQRLAYRMLGSIADAEDIVQEAFLRWLRAARDEVRVPEAFLRRTVTRLCLDQLKSARHRRETYIGPWLPEPLLEAEAAVGLSGAGDDLTLPLMLALERLSPLERAAFLLHDVFGAGFDEIAATLDRDAAACRQLAARARGHVRAARPRFPVAESEAMAIAQAFFAASRSGDRAALAALLAAQVAMHADGGGKRSAAARPILGARQVLQIHKALGVFWRKRGSTLLRWCRIDGLPGFVTREADGVVQTTALAIEAGRITAIYVVRNPDKLRHLG
ncbi:sigma-70 family RNA polymerase sigma factor [Sphingomonas morindae]|uniref:Sigma-70 family RNA polymerase sigma factor n=1 Tax=Sphingomonas morindae TaxID=1541170 RepID=A0ABY4X6K2_9SPHN|nr:sigma-70 family RNA polymerase sigma factor [Sphingomonas morindae]USI72512.1 sigma-70 family RNA polymerase sigma factor [Sphingomonas morindae]